MYISDNIHRIHESKGAESGGATRDTATEPTMSRDTAIQYLLVHEQPPYGLMNVLVPHRQAGSC